MKRFWIFAPLLGMALSGCDRQMRFSPVDMWNRSRYKPLEPEPFFADGSSSRTIPVGTVARGQLRIDETLYQGRKRGTGVAPHNLDYGYLGNGGTIGGTFNGAGPAGTQNNFDQEGSLSNNGSGSAMTNTGSRGINVLSGNSNGFGGAGNSAAGSGTAGSGMTATGLSARGGSTSNNVAASVGGDGVNRAVGDNGLGNDANLATEFPFPVTPQLLNRGQERFNIYCSPCHARDGGGNGMIVQRGFSPPPSFHITRLQNAPVGHFFDVITHGYGAMYPYASRVEPRDRWAIISYIRLLQQSRMANGIRTPQMDTPRSYASPGATKMQGSNNPGMTGQSGAPETASGTNGTLSRETMPGGVTPGHSAPGHADSDPVAPESAASAAKTSWKVRLKNDRIAQSEGKSEKRGTATR